MSYWGTSVLRIVVEQTEVMTSDTARVHVIHKHITHVLERTPTKIDKKTGLFRREIFLTYT